jgi:hypothetical protein
MYDLSQSICIRVGIWPQNSKASGDYAFIKKGNGGCNSAVGKQSKERIVSFASQLMVFNVHLRCMMLS